MKNIAIIFFLLLHSLVYGGSNDALIQGMTSSKRTSVAVSVGDVTGLVRSVSLTIDGKSYTFNPDNSTVIKDEEHGIYVLIAEAKGYHFKMWMVPGTEKVVSKSDNGFKSRFAAIIEATDPRKGDKWTMTPRITIGCTLDYSI